jgi:hypothetical protein
MSVFCIRPHCYRASWLALCLLLNVILLPDLCAVRSGQPLVTAPPQQMITAQQSQVEVMNNPISTMPLDARDSTPPRKSSAPKQAKLKANFEKMRSDAATLAELANSLKAELSKANPNELPAQVVEKVEQINKLAKRMRKATSNL